MRADDRPLFWKRAEVTEAAALIDGENYFRAFYNSALAARRYILLVGWQFELETDLLRGPEATHSVLPVSLWSLLRALCDRNDRLHVYVLAWDYSLVYVLERQWLQSARAKLTGHPRMRIEFRAHPEVIGAYHEKFVIIDDQVAFAGGMDFCESRWDTREHSSHNSLRRNALGLPSKPYHDMQAAVTGPVVRDLTDLFKAAWFASLGETLELPPLDTPPHPPPKLETLLRTEMHPLPAEGMALARTLPKSHVSPEVRELQHSYEHLIAQAQRLIYIETQYFTSSAIGNALRDRMRDESKPRLLVIILMPNGAESPKERFVLGVRQDNILSSLRATAKRYGHDLRLLCVTDRSEPGHSVATFIHSKLMIVDDRALSFGSANLTNRSMGFDSELNLVWNLDPPGEPVASIQRLRASLLAEHAGHGKESAFLEATSLPQQLDAELDKASSKLCRLPLAPAADDDDPLWTAVFDPSTELWSEHREELRAYTRETRKEGLLQRAVWVVQLAARLAVAFFSTRIAQRRAKRTQEQQASSRAKPQTETTRKMVLKFVFGLAILYAVVALLGKAFAEPMKELGRGFVTTFGLPGFALGTFLADGLHFPVPPQFYMLLTVALERPVGWALASITIGSLLGGALGYLVARRISHVRWIERRMERLQAGRLAKMMESHPYRWVVIASMTPVAYSWLCCLAGLSRFSQRAFILLCLLRVPKLLLYFAIVHAGWAGLGP